MNRLLLSWLLLLLVGTASAAEDELLPAERAFRMKTAVSASTIEATWDIAPGYYLYRDRFKFEPLGSALRLGAPVFPKGKRKDDPYFGPTEIYTGRVALRIPFEQTGADARVRLRITAQGCNEPLNVCYPPMRNDVVLEVAEQKRASAPPLAKGSGNGSGPELIPGLATSDIGGAIDPEDAFQVDVVAIDPANLLVRFSIADCCYLYKNKMRFDVSAPRGTRLAGGPRLGTANLPAGEMVTDEFFGHAEIYRRRVDLRLPLRGEDGTKNFELNVTYQGCAETGVAICYEPITRRFPINYSGHQLTVGPATIVRRR